MYTATHYKCIIQTCLFFYSNHMFNIAVVNPFLNVPQCTLSYLIHSQIYFRGVCMTKKKKKKKEYKCVIVEVISKSGGDLFNGAQYACLSTRSQIFSSSWLGVLGVWILTLS